MNSKHNNLGLTRRNFLLNCGLASVPIVLPHQKFEDAQSPEKLKEDFNQVNFMTDGLFMSPDQYIQKLSEINQDLHIQGDFYGAGGITTTLEKQFAEITGKEKAIYLPSGTMANQLAIKLLNGLNTKVIVPENSHIFRDEADAAQSVHNKRLVAIGKGKPYFELPELETTIGYLSENEVFHSGLGTVVIENPVRRADGTAVPVEIIHKISEYCKANGYMLHLDGARIHIASAYTNVSMKEYASYFDTIYISLYKYLNAAGGAMLCGDAKIIDQASHQIKILGGTVYQTWPNTAMAHHYLQDIEKKWRRILANSEKLITELNKLPGVTINKTTNGTNIHDMSLAESIDLVKLANYLHTEHEILLGRQNDLGIVKFKINESILNQPIQNIYDAWVSALKVALK